MNYKLDTSNSSQHYLDIEFRAKVSGKKTTLQLPAWRPGRYELGNFAKRINKNTWSAVIFPEGTRSRDGRPKSFSTNGIKMILKRIYLKK